MDKNLEDAFDHVKVVLKNDPSNEVAILSIDYLKEHTQEYIKLTYEYGFSDGWDAGIVQSSNIPNDAICEKDCDHRENIQTEEVKLFQTSVIN